jgi:RNase P subunit RPR2
MAQEASLSASPTLPAQLNYLNEAAHLLAFASPQTSSYLMSRCSDLMLSNEIEQTGSYRRHICGGCGAIMMPGLNSSVLKETFRISKGKSRAKPKEAAALPVPKHSMLYKCNSCHRETHHNIANAALRAYHKKTPHQNISIGRKPDLTSSQSLPQAGGSISANASSKKRAKNRKQSGLQALLAKSKEPSKPSGGFGLDLLDLMKH